MLFRVNTFAPARLVQCLNRFRFSSPCSLQNKSYKQPHQRFTLRLILCSVLAPVTYRFLEWAFQQNLETN